MKKSTIISLAALVVAIIGVLIALAAYFSKKKESFCDEFDDELMYDDLDDAEYYDAHISDEDDYCECPYCDEEEVSEEEIPEEETI